MILYVNGDSHSAAGEAVNDYCFAEDDPKYFYKGRAPHPDNLAISYGAVLASIVKAKFICGAESASSNDRIIRTTREFLTHKTNDKTLVIIGWSTWEREEWLHDRVYWQVNAGGIGEDWPDAIKERYKPWVVDLDMHAKVREQHAKIWDFHQELTNLGVKHLFFNTFEPFSGVTELDWGNCYVNPYKQKFTYYKWAIRHEHKPVREGSYHFGKKTHFAWAQQLLNHLTKIL